ncbi:hypothetical protein HPO96_30830 [Kribbella sandramycini]|uniref:DUF6571 domain-containing protein n=1 Tax=Kribbella sandramycini TaxID=60450 RepID=A0A7Y4L775_9ACTN|nr:DUF6571 family protein [Kribbella sandramycini]MBB6566930.1 hypothetical protein [Kribbella sandramycini]NOL44652.1 hypothetical protein [Kribbella sandramycini]
MVMSGIGLAAMADLIGKLAEASKSLTDSAGSMKSSSTHVFGTASGTTKISQSAGWINDQLPGLRRRLALAQQIEAQTQGPQSTVQIDESLLSNVPPAQAQADGAAAAKKLKESDGKLDPDLIAQITKYQNDPYFAAGFARSMTPTEMSDYLLRVSRQRDEIMRHPTSRTAAEYEKWKTNYPALVSAMGTTLGTATRNTGELALPADFARKYAAAITEGGTQPGDGGQVKYGQASALTLLMRYGQYSTEFLGTVSNTVYDYEREHGKKGPVWQPRSYYPPDHAFGGAYMPDGGIMPDPMANIMEALSHNPQAAQNFFDVGNPNAKTADIEVNGQKLKVNDRMKYLLQARTWKYDNADALGNALQAATTNWRDRSENGRISAVIASQTFLLLGQKAGEGKKSGDVWALGLNSRQGWKPGTDMRDSLAHILASYSPDLIRVAGTENPSSDPLGGGWTAEAGDSFPPGGPYGAVMSAGLMRKLLGVVGEEQKNLTIVSTGVLAAGQLMFGHSMAEALKKDPNAAVDMIKDDEKSPVLNAAATQLANTLGFVMTAGYEGDKTDQEFQKKRAEAISKALGVALKLPVIPSPTGDWSGLIIDQAKSAALDGLGKGPKQDAKELYNPAAGDGQDSLRKLAMNSLLANGYFDPKFYQQANTPDAPNKFVPPPPGAFKMGPDGKPLVPLRFDFESKAYLDWGERGGQAPYEWIQGTIVDVYRDEFPLFGG